MDDLELEDERNDDNIVQDHGFASRSSWAQKGAKHFKKSRKPSNEVANGDRMDDLELENERDDDDHIVQDHGFASRSSWAQKGARHFKKSRNPSDEVANGDRMDDLELEDRDDDNIVQDHGFAARSSWAQMPRHHRRHQNYIQTSVNPSDEVANGDEKEDLEVEDERDNEDGIVQDHGFAARSSWVQLGFEFNTPSDEVANGDEKEDLEVLDERDPEDEIVQDFGLAARSSWVQLKDNVKVAPILNSYSDELANGDKFDDK